MIGSHDGERFTLSIDQPKNDLMAPFQKNELYRVLISAIKKKIHGTILVIVEISSHRRRIIVHERRPRVSLLFPISSTLFTVDKKVDRRTEYISSGA